jgi:PAS domain S-box-containing protein
MSDHFDTDIFTILQQSPQGLQILFESAPDTYYIHDLMGTFLAGNKAAEELIGYKREELIGSSFLKLDLLTPQSILKAATTLAQNALGFPTGPDEYQLKRKDGQLITIEVHNIPITVKDQKFVLGIARDITERKKLEEDLKNRTDELEKTNKFMVDRELKMVEMKTELNQLKAKLNQ